MINEKSILKSKTFWLNMLALALGLAQAFQGEMAVGTTLTAMSVVNIVLRVVTTEAVKWDFWN